MIIFFGLLLLLLLEWYKKVHLETSVDRDQSYVVVLTSRLFLPYLCYLIWAYLQASDAADTLVYNDGYVVRPPEEQNKQEVAYLLRNLFMSNTSVLLYVFILTAIIHGRFLMKQLGNDHRDKYTAMIPALNKWLLWFPFITLGLLVMIGISATDADNEFHQIELAVMGLCAFILLFYAVSFFVIRRITYLYDLSFPWWKFLLRFLLNNAIAIGLVFVIILVMIANTDFSH